MNIYSFIMPEDTARYCEEIHYEFSPIEMISIICKSERPLSEKLEAYKYINNTCQDTEMPNTTAGRSYYLHEYLNIMIPWQEKAIKDFLKKGNASFRISSGSLKNLGIFGNDPIDEESKKGIVSQSKDKFALSFISAVDESDPNKRSSHMQQLRAIFENHIINDNLRENNDSPLCQEFETFEDLLSAVQDVWAHEDVNYIRIEKVYKKTSYQQTADIDKNGVIYKCDCSNDTQQRKYPGDVYYSFELPKPKDSATSE